VAIFVAVPDLDTRICHVPPHDDTTTDVHTKYQYLPCNYHQIRSGVDATMHADAEEADMTLQVRGGVESGTYAVAQSSAQKKDFLLNTPSSSRSVVLVGNLGTRRTRYAS